MNFAKVSIISGISTIIKILLSFIINKFTAIYLGPSGMALLGQFINFINIITPFSSAGISSGLIKYISENNDNYNEQKEFISSAIFIVSISSIIIPLIIFIFSSKIAFFLFNNYDNTYIINLANFSIFITSIMTILTSIMNGLKKITNLIISSILSNVVNALLSVYLIIYFNFGGALLSYLISPVISFIFTILYSYKIDRINDLIFKFSYKKDKIIKLLSYSLMTLTTVITSNLSQIFIRKYVISYLSIIDAGYWQGINKISDMYLMFITSTLSLYYLPRLSEIKNNSELYNEIKNMYIRILPILAITNILIYFFRSLIIKIVFTEDFLPMQNLFAIQMIGDFFKISSWLIAFVMVAKAMTKSFIFLEITFSIYYILSCIFFSRIFNLEGLAWAYALNYITYQIVMMYLFRSLLFMKNKK
ncbi:MAG: O-antigen translocase [Candidatus Sericytochromatia bacterium]